MAPEVLEQDPKSFYSEKCDVWSLGLCFYFLIFGKIPFSNCHNYTDLLH